MSFWISGATILQLRGAFWIAFLTFSFSSVKSSSNSRKFPWFVEFVDSSWPRKAKPWCSKYQTDLIVVVTWRRYSCFLTSLCLLKEAPIDWSGFNKLSHLSTVVLWKLSQLLPTWSHYYFGYILSNHILQMHHSHLGPHCCLWISSNINRNTYPPSRCTLASHMWWTIHVDTGVGYLLW